MLTRLTSGRVAGYVAVAVAGALLGAGGLAFASSSGSVIHACANKRTGALRLAASCSRREKAVVWNVQGPQGLQGLQGPRGLTGQQGPPGTAGTASSWADVTPAGTVLESSANWTGHVTRLGTGNYCVTPGTTPPSITPNLNVSDPVVANVIGGITGCNVPFGNVWLIDPISNKPVDEYFTVTVP